MDFRRVEVVEGGEEVCGCCVCVFVFKEGTRQNDEGESARKKEGE